MAGLRGLFKARFCLSLAADYRDLPIAPVRRHRHALRAAGFSAIVAHPDAGYRTGRERIDRLDQGSRRIDWDCGAGIVGNTDVAPVVPGGEGIDVSAVAGEAVMMAMMALHEVRERPSDMRAYGKRPGDRRREGAATRAEGNGIAPERRRPGADHERRTVDHGCRVQTAAETSEPSTQTAAGKGRVGNQQRSPRHRQGGQTNKFSQHCGLRCGTKSRRTHFRPRNKPRGGPPVCRLNRRTDFHPKLTAWLEPALTPPRLHSGGTLAKGI